MQLSPLQSRLAASLAASLALLVLYLLLFSPSAALAAELPFPIDYKSVQSDVEPDLGVGLGLGSDHDFDHAFEPEKQTSYEPSFAFLDRSILGRATLGELPLQIDKPEPFNIPLGQTGCFPVSKSDIFEATSAISIRSGEYQGYTVERADEIRDDDDRNNEEEGHGRRHAQLQSRSDSSRTIYISANTCLQPNGKDPKSGLPPQLTMFVSNSSSAKCPGSKGDVPDGQWVTFYQGSAMLSLNVTGGIHIGITAPQISKDFLGGYNIEIAASLRGFYHSVQEKDTELLWMDSDSNSALLLTGNQTKDDGETAKILREPLPFELFVNNENFTSPIDGLRYSICGLEKHAQLSANRLGSNDTNNMVRTDWTTRGPGGFAKQQFYFEGLNVSSNYSGILVKMGTGGDGKSKRQERDVTNGGIVFKATNFQTSAASNCKVVTDLDFCDEIQYAVPGNDQLNNTELAKVYDNYAKRMYSNFEKVLMQIPCEAPATSRYSLARSCEDCKVAYKRWLCTVSIPRCEDFNSDNRFAIVRNVGRAFPNGTNLPDDIKAQFENIPWHNSSRNSFIDSDIKPGPYKEILPCDDICYEVVRSCPAKMGLACPLPRMTGFEGSYGRRDDDGSTVSCNYPGEARTPVGGAQVNQVSMVLVSIIAVSVTISMY